SARANGQTGALEKGAPIHGGGTDSCGCQRSAQARIGERRLARLLREQHDVLLLDFGRPVVILYVCGGAIARCATLRVIGVRNKVGRGGLERQCSHTRTRRAEAEQKPSSTQIQGRMVGGWCIV